MLPPPSAHCYIPGSIILRLMSPPSLSSQLIFAFTTPFDVWQRSIYCRNYCTVHSCTASSQLLAKTFHLSFHSSSTDAASPISQRNLRRRWEDPPLESVSSFTLSHDWWVIVSSDRSSLCFQYWTSISTFTFSLGLQCHNSQSGILLQYQCLSKSVLLPQAQPGGSLLDSCDTMGFLAKWRKKSYCCFRLFVAD